jgi:hypothetical protein
VVLILIAPVAAVVVLAVATASDWAAVALGAVALRQPRSRGGHVLALWTLSFSVLFGLISAGILVTVVLFHPAFH